MYNRNDTLESRVSKLERLLNIHNTFESADIASVNSTRSAASLLKRLGFRKGKSFRGVSGAHYYIGDNCGLILYSNGIYFPKKYDVSDNIIETDYTLKNSLPTLGLSTRHGATISESTLEDIVAYTLLNNGRDVVLFFPTTVDEIKENIEIVKEDGDAIRSIIESYLESI